MPRRPEPTDYYVDHPSGRAFTVTPPPMYPASCPRCGAPATSTMWADDRIPIYGCGSWGSDAEARCFAAEPIRAPASVHWRDGLALRNVVGLSTYELHDLGEVVADLGHAWATVARPRLGLCELDGCTQTAIDGRCMEHSRPAFNVLGDDGGHNDR